MKPLLLLLGAVAPGLARAYDWRADLETTLVGPEALIAAICTGLAWFWIRGQAGEGRKLAALLVCVAIAVGAVLLPGARLLLAALAVAFLAYGFIWRT